jgi:alanine racemase
MRAVPRSSFTVDLAAVRHNAGVLVDVLGHAALWAVVKADGYGHGAADVALAALDAGAKALCVATVPEGVALRRALREPRIVVLGPAREDDLRAAREARLELAVGNGRLPEGVPLHLKLDTGMGRWGWADPPPLGRDVVGVMSHFASADVDPVFTSLQIERFLSATEAHSHLERHLANSAGALRFPEARLDAARCGIALYGVSPFGGDPTELGLRPVLRWESELAHTRLLAPGESTGYGRRFVADRPTWIGLVPVGYADGFRRDMTGTTVAVAGRRCRVVGTVSMDVFAVELPGPMPSGTPVTILGDGITVEHHAAVAGTIGYEILCGVNTAEPRARREVAGDSRA